VANHLGRVASDLFLFHESRPFDHLLVGTLNELWPDVQRGLHPYLRERIRGRIDIDVEHSTLDEVCDAVRPAIGEHVRTRERALLDQLAQEVGRGGRATAGLTETLRALDDRRVATLLLRAGARGTERALHLAIAQSADIVVVRHHDDLARHDGVAALLRF
jgi:peptide subunit release factor 1 (eRF1)